VRMNTDPPSAAVTNLAAFVDTWQPPPPLGFIAYAHLLPAALAEDLRRKAEPYATDAARVAFALLSADHVPIRGAFGTTAFYGRIRLTPEEWKMLFTALAERVRPAGSSAGITRNTRFLGIGIVEGLHGSGDGPQFPPLRVTLSLQLTRDEIRRRDLSRYALVSIVARLAPDQEGPSAARLWLVTVSPIGPANDLRGGTLVVPAIYVRLSGPVRSCRGLDYGVDASGVELVDEAQFSGRRN
jgi:hypothetical protein